MKILQAHVCRIGSDAAKDELEGQRSCRAGGIAVRSAETKATRLMGVAAGGFAGISGPFRVSPVNRPCVNATPVEVLQVRPAPERDRVFQSGYTPQTKGRPEAAAFQLTEIYIV